MLNRQQFIRPLAAIFMAVLVLQVYILQGLHCFMHHHHHETAAVLDETASPHIQTESDAHFDCLLCLFHFAPTHLEEKVMLPPAPKLLEANPIFTYISFYFSHHLQGLFLRGPPLN